MKMDTKSNPIGGRHCGLRIYIGLSYCPVMQNSRQSVTGSYVILL